MSIIETPDTVHGTVDAVAIAVQQALMIAMAEADENAGRAVSQP